MQAYVLGLTLLFRGLKGLVEVLGKKISVRQQFFSVSCLMNHCEHYHSKPTTKQTNINKSHKQIILQDSLEVVCLKLKTHVSTETILRRRIDS